jgi:hypothetical protein
MANAQLASFKIPVVDNEPMVSPHNPGGAMLYYRPSSFPLTFL